MHFVKAKGILSAQNGMNIYRGCTHGCIYCDSRSLCYRFTHAFEDIEVKENAVELLEAALCRKRNKCMIGTGAMSDPYIPEENTLEYTRRVLQTVLRHGFGITVHTKSNGILRDLDLLREINIKAKCVVQTTLTTVDEHLCKKIEPNVASTKERFEMLCTMRDNGIPTVVWLCPILPFINDTAENIEGLVEYCKQADVYGIINFGMGLTLRDGNREYFYKCLDRLFPGMKERYIRTFGNRYEVASPRAAELDNIFRARCKSCGIICDNDAVFAYLHEFPKRVDFEQISMF